MLCKHYAWAYTEILEHWRGEWYVLFNVVSKPVYCITCACLHISVVSSYIRFCPLLRQPPTSHLQCLLHIWKSLIISGPSATFYSCAIVVFQRATWCLNSIQDLVKCCTCWSLDDHSSETKLLVFSKPDRFRTPVLPFMFQRWVNFTRLSNKPQWLVSRQMIFL